eukprot:UN34405
MEDKYELEDWLSGLLDSSVFYGAIAGMVIMGYLGDVIGRNRAMLFTMTLLASGALGSALCSWGSGKTIYITIACFRFLLGIGSGGVYPLYAAKAVEECQHGGDVISKSQNSARGFFWRLPGALLVFVVAIILHFSGSRTEFQWRVSPGNRNYISSHKYLRHMG